MFEEESKFDDCPPPLPPPPGIMKKKKKKIKARITSRSDATPPPLPPLPPSMRNKSNSVPMNKTMLPLGIQASDPPSYLEEFEIAPPQKAFCTPNESPSFEALFEIENEFEGGPTQEAFDTPDEPPSFDVEFEIENEFEIGPPQEAFGTPDAPPSFEFEIENEFGNDEPPPPPPEEYESDDEPPPPPPEFDQIPNMFIPTMNTFGDIQEGSIPSSSVSSSSDTIPVTSSIGTLDERSSPFDSLAVVAPPMRDVFAAINQRRISTFEERLDRKKDTVQFTDEISPNTISVDDDVRHISCSMTQVFAAINQRPNSSVLQVQPIVDGIKPTPMVDVFAAIRQRRQSSAFSVNESKSVRREVKPKFNGIKPTPMVDVLAAIKQRRQSSASSVDESQSVHQEVKPIVKGMKPVATPMSDLFAAIKQRRQDSSFSTRLDDCRSEAKIPTMDSSISLTYMKQEVSNIQKMKPKTELPERRLSRLRRLSRSKSEKSVHLISEQVSSAGDCNPTEKSELSDKDGPGDMHGNLNTLLKLQELKEENERLEVQLKREEEVNAQEAKIQEELEAQEEEDKKLEELKGLQLKREEELKTQEARKLEKLKADRLKNHREIESIVNERVTFEIEYLQNRLRSLHSDSNAEFDLLESKSLAISRLQVLDKLLMGFAKSSNKVHRRDSFISDVPATEACIFKTHHENRITMERLTQLLNEQKKQLDAYNEEVIDEADDLLPAVQTKIKQLEFVADLQDAHLKDKSRVLVQKKIQLQRELVEMDQQQVEKSKETFSTNIEPKIANLESKWSIRLEKENESLLSKVKQLETQAKHAAIESKRKLESRFLTGFNPRFHKLQMEKDLISREIATLESDARKMSSQLQVLDRKQAIYKLDKFADVDTCVADNTQRIHKEQAKRIACYRQKIYESWENASSEDGKAKLQLALISKLELVLPFQDNIAESYKRQIDKFHDALAVYKVLQERENLQKSVKVCQAFIAENDPSTKDTMVQMLHKENSILQQKTIDAARLMQSWESKYNSMFTF